MTNSVAELYDRIELDETTGCMVWTGRLDRKGVPVTTWRGRTRRIHVILAGDTTHTRHRRTCQTDTCVNPDHYETLAPVKSGRAFRPDGTCARRGHDLTQPGAVYVAPNGARRCRACAYASTAAYAATPKGRQARARATQAWRARKQDA